MKLNKNNLTLLPKNVKAPNYKLEDLKAGIVHFGVGNFHRSHQAVYLHELFNQGLDLDWAIVGSGVRSHSAEMKEMLEDQDFLYSLVEQSANSDKAEVLGVITDYVCGNDCHEAIIEKLCEESIKIVSLTITEGGYFIDNTSGLFANKDPDIIYDSKNTETPKTVFGFMIAALKRRKERGIKPFTIMSCDNIPHNGNVTKNTMVGLSKLSDETFSKWIEENVAFPNGMVDRITPATTKREKDLLKDVYGLEDEITVFSEDFKQWVLEDNFPTGRPALEKVGVEFVEDVSPYEHMKIRILNGGHATIAYIAALLDIEFGYEAMANPLVLKFFQKVQEKEILPILPPVPNTDLFEYYKKIEERFSNPKIADTISRLCYDGSNRQPKFIIPSIADCVEQNVDMKGLALESALWCRYCYGKTSSGKIIENNDPIWDRLNKTAIEAKENPLIWLEMEDIYGDVGKSKVFQDTFTEMLDLIWENGVERAVKAYIDME